MNIHEFQAKNLLSRFQVAVPRGDAADSPEAAAAVAQALATDRFVVKAQIHAGGRGKAGGVRFAGTPQEVGEAARALLGSRLVTHQTGPEGKEVLRVLIEEATPPEEEMYVAILLDRAARRHVLIACGEGGIEIEEVAARAPEQILRETIDPAAGLQPYQTRNVLRRLPVPTALWRDASQLLLGLYEAYRQLDASLVEVNPLGVTGTGRVLALDAKMNFDDSALFRHPEVAALRDTSEEDPRELAASQFHLSYIHLDGNIGCMVNGAGLAMATMDIIKSCGGDPANFLDVGGGASTDQVREAFKILASDPQVEAILVNIFGGIMRCDVIAEGIVAAARQVDLTVPLVVRLEGTNVTDGRRILAASGLPIRTGATMAEAAELAVEAARHEHARRRAD